MELFENTLFINLDGRKDRLKHVKEQMKIMEINAERVSAIKTEDGAVGCTMSHIKCLELAKSRGYKQVFICEDDIVFKDPSLYKENLKKFYKNNEINWDILIVGGNNVPPFHKVNDYCIRILNCQTTTGYIVKQHMYDVLITNFKESATNLTKNPNNKRDYALDIYWKKLQPQYYWYMLIPPTVSQYESYSDIEKKNVAYDWLMLDNEKEWYVKQKKQQEAHKMTLHKKQVTFKETS